MHIKKWTTSNPTIHIWKNAIDFGNFFGRGGLGKDEEENTEVDEQ